MALTEQKRARLEKLSDENGIIYSASGVYTGLGV